MFHVQACLKAVLHCKLKFSLTSILSDLPLDSRLFFSLFKDSFKDCSTVPGTVINNNSARRMIKKKLKADIFKFGKHIMLYICMKDDLQLGKLMENCLLLKLYRKLRKMLLRPRRESNPQPSDLR